MEEEVWLDVVGYEGLYQVSNYGRVYSISLGRQLSIFNHNTGYKRVRLAKNGHPKTKYVHVLVAEAFIGRPDDGKKYVVNHKDENRANNYVGNLEFVTHRENLNYSHNLHREEQDQKRRESARRPKPIITVEDGRPIHVYETIQVAAKELDTTPGLISRRIKYPDLIKKPRKFIGIDFYFLDDFLGKAKETQAIKNENIVRDCTQQ